MQTYTKRHTLSFILSNESFGLHVILSDFSSDFDRFPSPSLQIHIYGLKPNVKPATQSQDYSLFCWLISIAKSRFNFLLYKVNLLIIVHPSCSSVLRDCDNVCQKQFTAQHQKLHYKLVWIWLYCSERETRGHFQH